MGCTELQQRAHTLVQHLLMLHWLLAASGWVVLDLELTWHCHGMAWQEVCHILRLSAFRAGGARGRWHHAIASEAMPVLIASHVLDTYGNMMTMMIWVWSR
jgi:hypothetical protein